VLPELKIYQIEKKKDVAYAFDNDRNKILLNDSFLTADPRRYNYSVKLNDITKISVRNGTHFWDVAAWGAGIGFIFGFFTGGYFTMHGEPKDFHIEGALVGGAIVAIPLGLLGGLIGLLIPDYDVYDLNKINSDKEKYLLDVFKKHKLK
jgi:hypothetical protein